MSLEDTIRKVLKEARAKNSQSKNYESAIRELILTEIDIPSIDDNFYDFAVEVYKTDWSKEPVCQVVFLAKEPFSMRLSDEFHTLGRQVKKVVKQYFPELHVTTSNTVYDNYMSQKWWYDEKKF